MISPQLEAAQLRELEGLVSLAHGLKLEAVEVLVVVVGQLPETGSLDSFPQQFLCILMHTGQLLGDGVL
jgi:hypothetical protein